MSIDEMPAGRELDALVAEKVMGFVRVADDTSDYHGVRHGTEVLLPPGETLHSLREWLPRSGPIAFGYFVTQRYSTDIAAAWQVVERMRNPDFRLNKDGDWGCSFGGELRFVGLAPTAPLAICRAALKAVGGAS